MADITARSVADQALVAALNLPNDGRPVYLFRSSAERTASTYSAKVQRLFVGLDVYFDSRGRSTVTSEAAPVVGACSPGDTGIGPCWIIVAPYTLPASASAAADAANGLHYNAAGQLTSDPNDIYNTPRGRLYY